MALPTLTEITAIVSGITAIVVFLYQVWIRVIKPIRAFSRFVKEKILLLDEVSVTLRPNGGTSIRDVLDRLDSRTSLLEERQRANLDLNPTPFFESDMQGMCVFVNRAWCELTGIRFDEALGTGWLNSVAPADRERVADEWMAATREGRTFRLAYNLQNVRTKRITPVLEDSRPVNTRIDSVVGHYRKLMPVAVAIESGEIEALHSSSLA